MESNSKLSFRTKNVKEFFTSWYFWKPFIGIAAGAILGFLYFRFVGCKSGTCAITSNPFSSMLFGGLLGFLLLSSFSSGSSN